MDLVGLGFGVVYLKVDRSCFRRCVLVCRFPPADRTKLKHIVTMNESDAAVAPAVPQVKRTPVKKMREYHSWHGMIVRCCVPTNKDYPRYGARGITVDPQWRGSLAKFLSDMGPCPEGCSLDRIDNAKGYFPWNCQWASLKQQSRNRRNNVIVEIGGIRRCVAEWLEHFGLKKQCYLWRVRNGWSREAALTFPSRSKARDLADLVAASAMEATEAGLELGASVLESGVEPGLEEACWVGCKL
jgi:hypothetical protein